MRSIRRMLGSVALALGLVTAPVVSAQPVTVSVAVSLKDG